MRGKILCHIGPPKTATTSMQIALSSVTLTDFIYVGTFQPRDLNEGSLSYKLHKFCENSRDHTSVEKLEITQELSNLVNAGKTVFVSEEMFLVHQDHASIERKLESLKAILGDLPCEIVITIRDPILSLPSYFQEIFSSLPIHLQLNFSKFCRDHRATCYDYERLLSVLENVGFKDVILVDFDRLTAGNVDIGKLIGKSEYIGSTLSIEKHNSGKSGGVSMERYLPSVSLKRFGSSSFVNKVLNTFKIRYWPGYSHFVLLIDRIVLRRARVHELKVPEDIAIKFGDGYQKVKRQTLEEDV